MEVGARRKRVHVIRGANGGRGRPPGRDFAGVAVTGPLRALRAERPKVALSTSGLGAVVSFGLLLSYGRQEGFLRRTARRRQGEHAPENGGSSAQICRFVNGASRNNGASWLVQS